MSPPSQAPSCRTFAPAFFAKQALLTVERVEPFRTQTGFAMRGHGLSCADAQDADNTTAITAIASFMDVSPVSPQRSKSSRFQIPQSTLSAARRGISTANTQALPMER